MTDEEINKFFHTVVLGRCWHDFTDRAGDGRPRPYDRCGKCKSKDVVTFRHSAHKNPAYTQSLDLIALVEAKAKYQGLGDQYIKELCYEVEKTFTPEFANNMSEYECALATATANAPTRARALMSLPWEGEENAS